MSRSIFKFNCFKSKDGSEWVVIPTSGRIVYKEISFPVKQFSSATKCASFIRSRVLSGIVVLTPRPALVL